MMARMLQPLSVLMIFVATILPAAAVLPDEILDDPVQEERARDISAGLRCLVCQNQSIDDSEAELARDLRLLVRERIAEGDTNEQVIDYVVSRYGEFVLLSPRWSTRTVLLWSTPAILLLIGIATLVVAARRRTASPVSAPLTDAEKTEIERLMTRRDEQN